MMHRALRSYAAPPMDPDSSLVSEHAALLERCVRRVCARTGLWDREDDLWVAAALALVDAARRYDPSRAVPFAPFAEHRVRGALLDELRRMDHLPRRLRAQTEGARKAREKLRQSLGREPTSEEMCAELKVDQEALAALESLSLPPPALDLQDTTASSDPSPSESAELRQQKALLTEEIAKLPERLRTVLALHYVEGLTYREIATLLEVSEPRICQLHSQAIKAIKQGVTIQGL
jgi:RNA polymerase sigma factor for flagellar operon FliA